MFGALRVSGRTLALILRNVLKATEDTSPHTYKNTHSNYKTINRVWTEPNTKTTQLLINALTSNKYS